MIDRQLEGGPAVTLEELMAIVPGPDFPTGAMMLGQGGARNAYATGRGSIMMRATHIIEEGRNDRQSIVLTSIPFQVGKSDRKSTRLNSSHSCAYRLPSSA